MDDLEIRCELKTVNGRRDGANKMRTEVSRPEYADGMCGILHIFYILIL